MREGEPVTAQPSALMERYLDRLIQENEKTNVTRITDKESAQVLHLEDSLVALPEMGDAPEGPYADLGSGGGFPGVPLAIATGRPTLLVDSVAKKMQLVHGIVQELGIGNVEVYAGRIEDLARQRPGEFSVVTARALAQLSVLMELSSPLLRLGGRLICYKANPSEEELSHGLSLQDTLGFSLVSQREVDLHGNHRTILCFEKITQPSIKLPRKTGFAQKKPL